MAYRVKVRGENGKWMLIAREEDFIAACDIYNDSPVPRIMTGPGGVIHKQYSDNGFRYYGPDYREVGK